MLLRTKSRDRKWMQLLYATSRTGVKYGETVGSALELEGTHRPSAPGAVARTYQNIQSQHVEVGAESKMSVSGSE